ncbi:MAG: hypothetical protein WAS07_10320 [Micropruina sp.]
MLAPILLSLALLIGCTQEPVAPTGTLPVVSATSTASTSVTPSSTTDPGDTDCVVGTWLLDVNNFQGRAAVYLKSLGIPLDSLAMSGSQTLELRADGYLWIGTDLITNASVAGHPVRAVTRSVGSGDWGWNADGTLQVDDFEYLVEPRVPPGGTPNIPSVDWSAPVTMVCTDDTLTVRGSNAPLTGRFTRR